jgi:hypothetical protein
MGKSSWRRSQRPNHVQTLASKRLGWWYGDEVMCRNMGLATEELAICTPTNEVFSVDQNCWPVIPRPDLNAFLTSILDST